MSVAADREPKKPIMPPSRIAVIVFAIIEVRVAITPDTLNFCTSSNFVVVGPLHRCVDPPARPKDAQQAGSDVRGLGDFLEC